MALNPLLPELSFSVREEGVGLGLWIRAASGGRQIRLTYAELEGGHARIHRLLDELYEDGAEITCMCRADKPVPMHIRRLRHHPPTYCLVTNPHQVHEEDCPRHHNPTLRIPKSNKQSQINEKQLVDVDQPQQNLRVQQNRNESSDRKGVFMPIMDQLNDAQRVASTHINGPHLVVAAAGSGKTTMLLARIAHLLDSGTPPERILACTFTRKAANEMRDRLVSVVGAVGRKVAISTLHALAYKMMAPVLGEGWKVIPNPACYIERVLEPPSPNNRHGVGGIMSTSDALSHLFLAKADGHIPNDLHDPLRKVYLAYEALTTEHRRFDFEDLVLGAIRLFQTDSQFAAQWRDRFDYVLVDEFQDTNRAQWLFLLELVARTRNLFVVGDDWQSIYGFRGARPELMREFTRHFLDAKKTFLTVNYRSHELIVSLGQRIINLNQGHQIEKLVHAARVTPESAIAEVITVASDVEEARFAATEIETLRDHYPHVPWQEYAVLYRTHIQSRVYEEALADRNIPYQIVGDTHFYESKVVKTILSYLRAAQNLNNRSTWATLFHRPLWNVTEQAFRESITLEPLTQSEELIRFMAILEELSRNTLPSDAIRWIANALPKIVKQRDDGEPIRWMDSLISSASRFQSVPEFLRYVDFVVENSREKKSDAVQLMTIHRAKGLEFETVFVVGLSEGLLPHKKATSPESIQEETRLCYVAVSRAKENVYLLSAKSYGGREMEVSRFITDAIAQPQ